MPNKSFEFSYYDQFSRQDHVTAAISCFKNHFQQRFLYSGEDLTEWCVPITYTLSEDIEKFQNTTTKVWLTPGTSQTLHGVLEENEWIILNNQQVGKYHVRDKKVCLEEEQREIQVICTE